jgi:hypothetical protein
MKNWRSILVNAFLLGILAVTATALGLALAFVIEGLTGDSKRPNPGEWLQAAANIIGAAISGGVAAVVAIRILRSEQRAKEVAEAIALAHTLAELMDWMEDSTDEISNHITALAEAVPLGKGAIDACLSLFIGASPKLSLHGSMMMRISTSHAALIRPVDNINKDVDLLVEKARSLFQRQIGRHGMQPPKMLEPSDLCQIAVALNELGYSYFKVGFAEAALSVAADDAAQKIYSSCDSYYDALRKHVKDIPEFRPARPSPHNAT